MTRLALADFRSYAAAELDLRPGVTTLLGANGQGKTNVIEAVAYLATLGSHRVAGDAPLVRHGAERAILRAAVTSAERDSLIELEINPGHANRARLNRAPVRPRQVLGVLRTVLFAPEDLALVKGDPDGRRRYLDDLLVIPGPPVCGGPGRLRTGAAPADRAAQVAARAGRDPVVRGRGRAAPAEAEPEETGRGRDRPGRDRPGGHAQRVGRASGHHGRRTAGGQDQPDACAPPAGRQVLRRGGRRCGWDRHRLPPVV